MKLTESGLTASGKARLALALVAASIAGGTFAGIQHAVAGGSSEPGPAPSAEGEAPQFFSSKLKLQSTAIYSDNNVVTVGSGYQPLHDPVAIRCPGPSPCVLAAEQHQQVRSATAGNRWTVCTKVDGVFLTMPTCPFYDAADADGVFHVGSFSQSDVGFGVGRHTVQSFLYSDFGVEDAHTSITYRVYGA